MGHIPVLLVPKIQYGKLYKMIYKEIHTLTQTKAKYFLFSRYFFFFLNGNVINVIRWVIGSRGILTELTLSLKLF